MSACLYSTPTFYTNDSLLETQGSLMLLTDVLIFLLFSAVFSKQWTRGKISLYFELRVLKSVTGIRLSIHVNNTCDNKHGSCSDSHQDSAIVLSVGGTPTSLPPLYSRTFPPECKDVRELVHSAKSRKH